MKIYILTALILAISIDLNAQTIKCYVYVFDINSKYEKKEMDCEEFLKVHNRIPTKKDSIKHCQNLAERIIYQKKLIDLGYDFIPNGKLSEKFIRAHHKYLRKNKRKQRREIRNKTE